MDGKHNLMGFDWQVLVLVLVLVQEGEGGRGQRLQAQREGTRDAN